MRRHQIHRFPAVAALVLIAAAAARIPALHAETEVFTGATVHTVSGPVLNDATIVVIRLGTAR